MSKTLLNIALFVAIVAVVSSIPVQEDLETQAKWGAVGRAVGSATTSFSNWMSGKECSIKKCPACSSGGWGSRRRRGGNCGAKNECLKQNGACQAKIDSLKKAHAAYAAEIADLKKVVDSKKATQAQKEKLATDEKREMDIAGMQEADAKKLKDASYNNLKQSEAELAKTIKDMRHYVHLEAAKVHRAAAVVADKKKKVDERNEWLEAPAKAWEAAVKAKEAAQAAHAKKIQEEQAAVAEGRAQVESQKRALNAATAAHAAKGAQKRKEEADYDKAKAAAAAAARDTHASDAVMNLKKSQAAAVAKKIGY